MSMIYSFIYPLSFFEVFIQYVSQVFFKEYKADEKLRYNIQQELIAESKRLVIGYFFWSGWPPQFAFVLMVNIG